MLWTIGQSLINGLLTGGIYALVSVGITIVFGVMKMVNFAMGEFVTLGMYMTWVGYTLTGANTYLLIPFVIVTMAIIAFVCFKLSLQPLLGRPNTAFIQVTVGLSFFLTNAIQMVFSPNSLTVPSDIKSSALYIRDFSIALPRLIAFIVGLILVVAISIFLSKSMTGLAMRATAEKAEVAEMLGVNSVKCFTLAFIISISLAGVAGLLLTPIYFVAPTAGNILKTTSMMVVVLGGMGNIKGAMIAGLMVGVAEAMVASLIAPELGPAGIFLLFLFVVYFKPQGLFGKGERVG